MSDVLPLDICMQSPPVSPSQRQVEPPAIDLQGSSRISGGILCGRAMGNVFNNADADPISGYRFEHCMGWVQIYTAQADLTIMKPDMELKHEVTPRFTKVLQVLGHRYSPIFSMIFGSYFGYIQFLHFIFSDQNHCIFLYENSVWNIKGLYETAMEDDDDDVMWMHQNGEDILQILVVSILL
jgi:hypothetical protein